MLEKVPAVVGRSLKGVRAGLDALTLEDPRFRAIDATFELTSATFADGAALPASTTADGDGQSPPLAWRGAPHGTRAFALIVEDADSPSPKPLVHAIAWHLPAGDGTLPAGALRKAADGGDVDVGKNSFLGTGWLPPDPPTGHGAHRYVFQLFALDRPPALDGEPGRTALVEAIDGHVVAIAVLVGTYERRG